MHMNTHPIKLVLIHSVSQSSLNINPLVISKSVCRHTSMLSKKHISTLWSSLSKLYDHVFVDQYGQKDSGMWFSALKDLTLHDLNNGMKALHSGVYDDQFMVFPPNPMQFRMLCLAYVDGLRVPSMVTILNKLNTIFKKRTAYGVVVQFNQRSPKDH